MVRAIIRRCIREERSVKKGGKMGKNGDNEREEGNSKMGAEVPRGREKGPKIFLKFF